MSRKRDVKFKLRLPKDLLQLIQEVAYQNNRTVAEEMVAMLRDSAHNAQVDIDANSVIGKLEQLAATERDEVLRNAISHYHESLELAARQDRVAVDAMDRLAHAISMHEAARTRRKKRAKR